MTTQDTDTVGNLIRSWVHYDNAISDLNKQIKQMREAKNNYETQVLQKLESMKMKNPVIQISGGRILVAEEKVQQPLSFTMLESNLDSYYALKPGARNETKDILKYIREQRTSQSSPCLKRVMTRNTRQA
jgi:hypothetical protein